MSKAKLFGVEEGGREAKICIRFFNFVRRNVFLFHLEIDLLTSNFYLNLVDFFLFFSRGLKIFCRKTKKHHHFLIELKNFIGDRVFCGPLATLTVVTEVFPILLGRLNLEKKITEVDKPRAGNIAIKVKNWAL